MDGSICANLYGDSLLRFTVLDEAGRYRSLAAAFLERLAERFGICAVSRAHFGYTVDRGRRLLDRDLRAPLGCSYALLEYGGNDCDHDWKAVAAAPEAPHTPKTPLPDFTKTLGGMADDLAAAGVRPVLMTLPPIDAERYLAFIGRCGADARAVLRWLGDVQMIYRSTSTITPPSSPRTASTPTRRGTRSSTRPSRTFLPRTASAPDAAAKGNSHRCRRSPLPPAL
jgi:hypothetical protein